jgi:RND family efflux transporter MFP subunit
MLRRRSNCLTQAGISLVALLAIVSVGCDAESPTVTAAPKSTVAAKPVEVTAADLRPWPRAVRAQGSLVEDEEAELGIKVAGRVKEVLVDLGTPVKAGQTIAALESEEFELRIEQAEAQVEQARAAIGLRPEQSEESLDPAQAAPVLQEKAVLEEAQFNVTRRRALSGKGVITAEELQQYEAALRVAEAKYQSALNSVYEQMAMIGVRRAELKVAKQNLEDAVLKAPFAGVVKARHVAPGSYLNIGDAVATLVRADPLRFRAGVPERSSTRLRIGQPVRVYVEGESEPVESTITRISPSLDLASRSLTIEADIKNPDGRFRTGLFAEAEIVVDPNERALAVPENSIVQFAGVEKVWLVRDNAAVSQRVRSGRRQGSLVEILEGLKPNDVILANGQKGHEGPIRVASATAADHTELGGG